MCLDALQLCNIQPLNLSVDEHRNGYYTQK